MIEETIQRYESRAEVAQAVQDEGVLAMLARGVKPFNMPADDKDLQDNWSSAITMGYYWQEVLDRITKTLSEPLQPPSPSPAD